MSKNKNLILLLIFAVLGFSSYYLIKNKNQKSSVNTWDRKFAVEDTKNISKIFLSQKNGSNILLTKNGNHWLVNNKYKVFPNTIHYLLDLIQQIRVNSIPHKNAYPVIMNEIATIGIKVEIYEGDNKIRTYYVGGVTEDETGLYCLMEGSEQPYIMKDNRAPANLRVRYDIKEEDWRDRAVFNIDIDRIEQVKIDYPRNKANSFSILKEKSSYALLDSDKNRIEIRQDKILKNFLEEFQPIQAEAFSNTHRSRDSINSLIPYMSYEFKLKDQSAPYLLKFYPINEEVETPIDLSEEFLKQENFFRFIISRSDGDFLLVQKSQFKNVFTNLQELKSKLNI